MSLDRLNEKCGIFGIISNRNIIKKCLIGLHALQHRGQESFGIASFKKDGLINTHHSLGYVNQIFSKTELLDSIEGSKGIGHIRYSTSGGKDGIQPLIFDSKFGSVALAHNGNLINFSAIKKSLISKKCVFKTDIDTEIFAQLIMISDKNTLEEAVIEAITQVEGAFSLLIMNKDIIIGLRDSLGIRPLSIGKMKNAHIISSENCAIDSIDASFIREVKAGEVVVLKDDMSITSYFPFEKKQSRFCLFEYIYFSRPSTTFENKSIYTVRKNIGKYLALADEDNNLGDIVVPVPDSSIPSALGYSETSGIPFEFGVIRNHYTGRTFIQPNQNIREQSVMMKYTINKQIVENKRIILIDDSMVRGTTLRGVVSMLKKSNIKEIHLRIASPPTKFSCFYGIDTPSQEALIAHKMTNKEITESIGVTSLKFINIDGLYKSVASTTRDSNAPLYCDACFTGDYPIKNKDFE